MVAKVEEIKEMFTGARTFYVRAPNEESRRWVHIFESGRVDCTCPGYNPEHAEACVHISIAKDHITKEK
jgi:hypothetical protein